MASLGGGVEFATYINDPTPGHASAESYAGPFVTAQAGADIGGSIFKGKSKNGFGGNWVGASVSAGAGGGAAIVEWDYSRPLPVTLPKCLCDLMILSMP